MVASVTEVAVKVPAHNVPKKTDTWTTSREAASRWSGDIDGKKALSILLNCSVVEPFMCWCNVFMAFHEAVNS